MIKHTANKAIQLVEGTSMLAVVLGAGTTALAANGKPFLLGKNNVARAITTLTKQGAEPALNLVVDGKSSTDFLAADGKAADGKAADAAHADGADTLDGKNSTDFAVASSEAWKPISASGSTPFDRFYARWTNFDGTHGTVHLKGVVKSGSFYECCFNTEQGMAFLLPPGLLARPAKSLHRPHGAEQYRGEGGCREGRMLRNRQYPGRGVRRGGSGGVGERALVSLDGISFRAEG